MYSILLFYHSGSCSFHSLCWGCFIVLLLFCLPLVF